MEIPVLYIFTHDSIGVGEDGPTHQPVEQLASLRAMPGLLVFRPADANEVVETWRPVTALRPSPPRWCCPARLCRPSTARLGPASGVARGAYILAEAGGGQPDAILMATGSEVQLALAARDELEAEGIAARVVSMPCWELFDRQPPEYRDQVLPRRAGAGRGRQASTLRLGPLRRRRRRRNRHAHVWRVGAAEAVVTNFGFTPEHLSQVTRELVAAAREQAAS